VTGAAFVAVLAFAGTVLVAHGTWVAAELGVLSQEWLLRRGRETMRRYRLDRSREGLAFVEIWFGAGALAAAVWAAIGLAAEV
jgi:hypothetical protein